MQCPSCAGELSPSNKFCPTCAAPVGSPSQMPTAMAPAAQAPPVASPIGRLVSSDTIPVGGFTPGMVLEDRYRIIGLIGRGGMGEVYRADDLKLGQPVALKFLPKALADDPVRRERFYAEVRIARQVSHPNICRVYDIGELDGRHFLTMEYIDGEDLASLLKRIGNLHGAKALDVARQLCAGLAAAHDKGVLHRDLKPANVMLDGRGRVRVTDFGLAVAAGEEVPAGEVAGTPAYMAPEQFAGQGASVRSDIYALGLVLYELYTGRRAFEAKSLAELRAKKEGAPPAAPSEITREIDPIVERVILRCLEKDPRQRPASVAHVAGALPGGDPLAAAIAAGETPSPEMVAASGSKDGLKPWVAWACLAFVVLGIAAAVFTRKGTFLFERVPVAHPPDAMVKTARDLLIGAGYAEVPADTAFGFMRYTPYFTYVHENDKSSGRWNDIPDLAVQFWYRQSPRPIEHWRALTGIIRNASVAYDDPPMQLSGECVVRLDARGRLTYLSVIPRKEDLPAGVSQAPDWSPLFRAAGLDPANWTAAEPDWTQPSSADTRAAWSGRLPRFPESPMRIEATALRGKPVSWKLIGPWDLRSPSDATAPRIYFGGPVVLLCLAGAAFFARRNLRMGRGDRRGANRLAYFVCGLSMISWAFGEHHVTTAGEISRFISCAGVALFWAGVLWLWYIALEPFVRRRWPGSLVSWNRVLVGSFRDPLVGRDLLVGLMLGVCSSLLRALGYHLASWIGASQAPPYPDAHFAPLDILTGFPATVSQLSGAVAWSIGTSLMLFFLLFLLRVTLRREWIAVALALVLWTGTAIPAFNPLFPTALITAPVVGAILFVVVRYGLLAYTSYLLYAVIFTGFPSTTNLSAWYSGIGLVGLALLLGLAVYAFHTSLGGQPLFGRAALED